jgi:DUF2934 family protein
MAVRKVTKTQSRQKRAPEPEGAVTAASRGRARAIAAPAAQNGRAPSFEQIQRRAYELFIARGAAHGGDWADWFTAEHELTTSSSESD